MTTEALCIQIKINMGNNRKFIAISEEAVRQINNFLRAPENRLINEFWNVVEKYGSIEEINAKARAAGSLANQLERLKAMRSPYVEQVEWLRAQRDQHAFISLDQYRQQIGANSPASAHLDQKPRVVLEISACQYFPWLIAEARQAIERRELMPGRFIRVRNMKESEQDRGDLLAFGAAMNILGASYVETLDTKGTDGSNVHLGGPETITGYFGGVGQPNEHARDWLDEFLYYYTTYGVNGVLNINSGTVLLGHFLRQVGIRNEFKISVFLGNDNPYAIFSTLLTARLFAKDSADCPLTGLNFSNSINNESIRQAAEVRRALGLEEVVRFEHHITEAYHGIVRQPYDRRAELVELARAVVNISAKHEGGDVAVERERSHASSILDYFLAKDDIVKQGLMPDLERNYLDKHEALNITARALAEQGISFTAAPLLHYY